jgi:2',3'-cyclic-nucleotide 2'-phosphodiesterase (5'-nucleotidase family)
MKTTGWLLVTGWMAVSATLLAVGCGGDDEDTKSNPSPDAGTGGTGGAAGAAGSAGEAGTGGSAGEAGVDRKLMLIYTSDEHSDLIGFSPERDDYPVPTVAGTGQIKGGVARRATMLSELRDEAKSADLPTMTVSGGDNSMGTLAQVVWDTASLEWRLMHRLGYDMTTLGNHDFDLGLPGLAGALQTAKDEGAIPGIVATNIHFSDTSADDDALAALYSTDPKADAAIHAYRVIEADNGLRVGFIGYVGVDASVKAPFKAPVAFSEVHVKATEADDPAKVLPHLYNDLQPVVDKLRNVEGVDLVIALAHAGMAPSHPEISEDDKIAQNVAGIDVIISGHAHETADAPVVVKNATTGKDVIILNGGSNGRFVGRIDLTVPGDSSQSVRYDTATQALMPVTDTTVPDPEYTPMIDEAVETIEKAGNVKGQTTLEYLINQSLGTTVENDEAVAGDLYFYELATTTFDLAGTRSLAFLTADAHLLTLSAMGMPADFAIQAGGTIRTQILKGKTGSITVADAFRAVPLGLSPFDGTPGYPLVRVKIPIGAVRVLFEFTSGRGPESSSYDLTGGAIVAEMDCSRDPITSVAQAFDPSKGRVMKLWMDADQSDGLEQFDTLVWDRDNQPAGSVLSGQTYVMVTTNYIAQVMAASAVPLFDLNDQIVSPNDAVVFRADDTEVKELESFFGYIHTEGTIPDRYNPTSANATSRFQKMAFCP